MTHKFIRIFRLNIILVFTIYVDLMAAIAFKSKTIKFNSQYKSEQNKNCSREKLHSKLQKVFSVCYLIARFKF